MPVKRGDSPLSVAARSRTGVSTNTDLVVMARTLRGNIEGLTDFPELEGSPGASRPSLILPGLETRRWLYTNLTST
jgi:hypothetical protein